MMAKEAVENAWQITIDGGGSHNLMHRRLGGRRLSRMGLRVAMKIFQVHVLATYRSNVEYILTSI